MPWIDAAAHYLVLAILGGGAALFGFWAFFGAEKRRREISGNRFPPHN